jgi:hypothetical protein
MEGYFLIVQTGVQETVHAYHGVRDFTSLRARFNAPPLRRMAQLFYLPSTYPSKLKIL